MGRLLEYLFYLFGSIVIIYTLFIVAVYGWMIVSAIVHTRKQHDSDKQVFSDDYIESMFAKPVSVIVPAYNEEVSLIDCVRALIKVQYPQYEIIVVNDGSTDATHQIMIEHFEMEPVQKVIHNQLQTETVRQVYQSRLQPNIMMLEKENGGKADAINAGINASKYPYFCTIDADSILEEKALLRVMRPIVLSNERVVAAGGNVRVGNGNQFHLGRLLKSDETSSYLGTIQVIEYMRSFLMGRIALNILNSNLILSGAFSVFNKEWVLKAGGFAPNAIGEDMEIVIKLHRYFREQGLDKQIEYVPDPVCWTEAPKTIPILRKQRRRWQQGLFQSLWMHKKLTFNPNYGKTGMISFPYFWIVEGIGPVIELCGYIYFVLAFFLGDVYFEFALLFASLFVIFTAIFSVSAVIIDAWTQGRYPRLRELASFFAASMTEMVWYRPMVIFFRLEGIVRFIAGRKDWGSMHRAGLSKGETM